MNSGLKMDKKTFLVGMLVFGLIGLMALGVRMFKPAVGLRGTTYAEPYPVAPEISLTRHDGSAFQLSDLRGSIVLLFFGYTSCPDVCPTTLAAVKTAIDNLDAEHAGKLKAVFVTVDPQRDTPQRVQEYVDHFNKEFIGLSGSEAMLAGVWNDYGVYRSIADGSSATGYLVDHTARITLIDQDGNVRSTYGIDTPVEDIAHDLELLLQ
jgi:protein SCO1/2